MKSKRFLVALVAVIMLAVFVTPAAFAKDVKIVRHGSEVKVVPVKDQAPQTVVAQAKKEAKPEAKAEPAKKAAKQEARAEKDGGADNVVKSFFTLIGRPLLAPFFAIKNVVDNGGTPLRWCNSIVRSLREDLFDAPVDAAKFLASPFGVEPTPLDDVGEINQAIRDAGPVAEAIADAGFVGAVLGIVQYNTAEPLLRYGHTDMVEKAIAVTGGMSLASQALDPTSTSGERVKGVFGKLVRHGTEARRVVAKK